MTGTARTPRTLRTLREVRIAASFDAWRQAARALLQEDVPPDAVLWREAADDQPLIDGLFDVAATDVPDAAGAPDVRIRVPARFVELGTRAACHAEPGRWAVMYRVLWRLTRGEAHLLDVAVDPDVYRLLRMDKAVRRDVHKIHAFVRFRRVERAGVEHWIAWLSPAHHTLELAAPFFVRRFPNMRWSILSPGRCVHWDGEALTATPGVSRETAPASDALEALWRTYYASIFNPARPKPRAMKAEMPKWYWHALPEASLIGELLASAPRRVREMVARETRAAAPPAEERARGPRPAGGA